MGYLISSLMSRTAYRKKLDLTYELTKITTKVQMVTDQITEMQNSIERQVQQAKNDNTVFVNMTKAALQQKLAEQLGVSDILASGNITGLEGEQKDKWAAYQMALSQKMALIDAQSAHMIKQIESKREQMERMQLEPMKQEQTLLSTKKQTLQDQLTLQEEIFKAYDGAKGNDLKDLIPKLGGGQGG